jgi:hypothetical protein
VGKGREEAAEGGGEVAREVAARGRRPRTRATASHGRVLGAARIKDSAERADQSDTAMRNVLILGSGRSGTSMLAGAFAHAGWFVGAAPYPARSSNPKGFFESKEINGLNEYLLALGEGDRLGPWQRWLAELPVDWTCPSDDRAERRIVEAVKRAPYCFKDPRFSYTLPAWAPHTQDALRLCVFRHPDAVARSIVKECEQEDYLRGVGMTRERALGAWLAMHRRILDVLRADGEWSFVHYEQVLRGEAFERVEKLVGAPLAREFPEENLQRNKAEGELDGAVGETYAELCELARIHSSAATSVAQPRWIAAKQREPAELDARAMEARAAVEKEIATWLATGVEGRSAAWRAARGSSALDLERRIVDALPMLPAWRLPTARPAARRSLEQLAGWEAFARTHRAHGTSTWSELEAHAAWPLPSEAETKVLAWPTWTDGALAALLGNWCKAVDPGASACLCLRHDPALDGALETALEALERAYRAACDPERVLDVAIVGAEFHPSNAARLGRAIDGVLRLEPDLARTPFLEALGAPIASDSAGLRRLVESARCPA